MSFKVKQPQPNKSPFVWSMESGTTYKLWAENLSQSEAQVLHNAAVSLQFLYLRFTAPLENQEPSPELNQNFARLQMENITQIVPVFSLLIKNVTSYQVPGLTNHREFICYTLKDI